VGVFFRAVFLNQKKVVLKPTTGSILGKNCVTHLQATGGLSRNPQTMAFFLGR
jgi:hypothetical protein